MVTLLKNKKVACVISLNRAQELCESRGGRPGLPVPNKSTVSVNVKQHSTKQPNQPLLTKGLVGCYEAGERQAVQIMKLINYCDP